LIRLALLVFVTVTFGKAAPVSGSPSTLNQKETVKVSKVEPTVEKQPEVQPESTPVVEQEVQPPPVSGSCGDWLAQAGIAATRSVMALIGGESGCRPDAINPSSGACGIPQALPCSKMGCSLSDPVCQLLWMQSYVVNRYGSWDNAYATWQSRYPHWY